MSRTSESRTSEQIKQLVNSINQERSDAEPEAYPQVKSIVIRSKGDEIYYRISVEIHNTVSNYNKDNY